MKAEIITIGDEILDGSIIDTNSAWLANILNQNGIPVFQISSVSDDKCHIINALTEASSRVDLIIMTGGIGPTNDDITKIALCEYFNVQLYESKDVLENIQKIFSGRNILLSERNRKQAEVPENCQIIQYPSGSAPCMWFEENGRVYVSLPGVPFEMKTLMEETLIYKLKTHFNTSNIYNKTVLIQGLPESVLADKISDWEYKLPSSIKLAYLPSPGFIKLRLSSVGISNNEIEPIINKSIEELQLIIPDSIYGYDDQTLELIIGKLLADQSCTLATAESCTGGYISHKITSVPGSSEYYKGSIIAYSNEIKEKLLKVNPKSIIEFGAVSQKVVEEMVIGLKKRMNTDYNIATSGISGPGGGTLEKPVGTTWIAVSDGTNIYSRKFHFGKNRGRNIIMTGMTALNMLRNIILEKNK